MHPRFNSTGHVATKQDFKLRMEEREAWKTHYTYNPQNEGENGGLRHGAVAKALRKAFKRLEGAEATSPRQPPRP
jgi:hypothetical protein